MTKNRFGRRVAALALGGVLALSLTACQENPEGSIVAHKDMDKLISQAADTGSGSVTGGDVVQQAQRSETYQATIENESLGVTVNVNAQVEVPQVDKLSVYRVEQSPFDQAFLDKAKAALIGDETLYDGAALETRTKGEIEQEIQSWRQALNELEATFREGQASEGLTEEEIRETVETYKQEYQKEIDRLQEAYESAPAEIDLSEHVSDGKLHTVKEMVDRSPGDYFEWLNSLSTEGDQVFYGITDGDDGNYRFLYVQNNADYSNKLVYRSTPRAYSRYDGVVVGGTYLSTESARDNFTFAVSDPDAFWREKGLPGQVLNNNMAIAADTEFERLCPDTTLSQQEAQAQAEALLDQLGVSGFVLDGGGLYCELINLDLEDRKVPYASWYILQYRRQIDGVVLSQSSGGKFFAGQDQDGNFNKQMWPGELIEIRVNDTGIVGFEYHAPLTVTETVVDGAALKSFDSVKEIFEQMLPITLAMDDFDHAADIDRVRLSYSRISEKDSFDTGLVVPVWSFEGTSAYSYSKDEDSFEQHYRGTLMAINAIDGSVINADLGY